MSRHMHLGVFAFPGGNHAAGWRHPSADAITGGIDELIRIAQTAERGWFDLFFLSDGLHFDPSASMPASVLEPVVALSVLSAQTRHIGLAATASTTYSAPYNLARGFLSLDHVSGGRAGWNIVTTGNVRAAENFGLAGHPPHDARYDRALEFVRVVQGLWDSLPAEALLRDRATGRYVDAAQVRRLGHHGPHFAVAGPLNLERSPQGQPVLIQAGASEPGRDFAAAVAELVFSAQQSLAEGRAFTDDLARRAAAVGRPRPLVLPGVMPIIGSTEDEARSLYHELLDLVDSHTALDQLSLRFDADLTGLSLDDQLPELSFEHMEGNRSRAILLHDLARRQRLTLREVFAIHAGSRGHRTVIGTPQKIADDLIDWFEARAADGFNIMPAFFHDQFEIFVDQVVPILQRRGLFRTEYTTRTLRGHFGLGLPSRATPLKTELPQQADA